MVRSASKIGDKLQLADCQRAAAAEARALAAHLSAFNDTRSGAGAAGSSTSSGALSGGGGRSAGDEGGDGSGVSRGVARVFHDPSRSAEAARLAQRLLRMAHDAADLERAERAAAAEAQRRRAASSRQRREAGGGTGLTSAVAAAAQPASLAVAIDNLERYCDSLENRLLGGGGRRL